MGAIHALLNPEVFSEIPVTSEQIHKVATKIILEGVLSDEGREKYLNKNVFSENNGEYK